MSKQKNRTELGIWLVAGAFSYLIIAYGILRAWTRAVAVPVRVYTLQEDFYLRFWFLEYPLLVVVLLVMVAGIYCTFREDFE
jgi:uncharacterized integral membrane protein